MRKADYSDQFYRTFMDHRSVPVCEQRSAPHTARTHPTALLNVLCLHSRTREPEAAILSRPMDALNPGSKRFPRIFFTPQDVCHWRFAGVGHALQGLGTGVGQGHGSWAGAWWDVGWERVSAQCYAP